MDIAILDPEFNVIDEIDGYTSLIWTDRYDAAGDFEIYTRASLDVLQLCQAGRYAKIPTAETVMLIEEVNLETDVENGDHVIIKGRSLEAMLNNSVIFIKTSVKDFNLQDLIQRILNENIISPTDPNREISNFMFEASLNPLVTSPIITIQLHLETIYETVQTLCANESIGFRLRLSSTNQFVFSLYAGEDRSGRQTTNPYVIFAPSFENISSSRYFESTEAFKNVAVILGTFTPTNSSGDTGTPRELVEVIGEGIGINRRELYVDARDLSSQDEDSERYYTETQMREFMRERGREALKEASVTKTFDGEIDTSRLFTYGRDFFLGDIVEIANAYGLSSRARVVELVRTDDASGYKEVPSFIMLNDEEG